MRHALPALLLVLAAFRPATSLAGEAGTTEASLAEALRAHVATLASDEWEGRGAGTPGEAAATQYIADHFARLGLEPLGIDGSFFQPVEMPGAFRAKPACRLVFEREGSEPLVLARGDDWMPFSATADGKVGGEIVFAGYGVRAPDLSYDDYDGLDVKGKVVVVFRHTPQGPWWNDPEKRMRHAPLVAKLKHAAERGAAALVVVNDPRNFAPPREGERAPRRDVVERNDIGRGEAKIPFAHMTLAAAERLFPLAFDATPRELERDIHGEEGARPASRTGKGRLRLEVETNREVLHGRNVCALLRAGAADATDEVIVVGAHHDHLGRGGRGSLARGPAERKEIHNGADDNASGVAGVLELATLLSARRAELRRSILFLTFTGEERGLLGSRHFADHPTIALSRVAAMLNLDMIGRLEGRKLFIGGVKTSPVFVPLLKRFAAELEMDVAFGDGGRAPSDNTSFYAKRIPVLFFFTGMHPDYHRPTDDVDRIDALGMEHTVRLAARVAEALAESPERPVFVRADGGGGPPRAVLGVVVEAAPGGVRITRLQPDAPAARAGLLAGDVIVAIDGAPTADLVALRDTLGRREAGDRVEVTVRRGDEELTVDIELARG